MSEPASKIQKTSEEEVIEIDVEQLKLPTERVKEFDGVLKYFAMKAGLNEFEHTTSERRALITKRRTINEDEEIVLDVIGWKSQVKIEKKMKKTGKLADYKKAVDSAVTAPERKYLSREIRNVIIPVLVDLGMIHDVSDREIASRFLVTILLATGAIAVNDLDLIFLVLDWFINGTGSSVGHSKKRARHAALANTAEWDSILTRNQVELMRHQMMPFMEVCVTEICLTYWVQCDLDDPDQRIPFGEMCDYIFEPVILALADD